MGETNLDENRTILCYYAKISRNFFPNFRETFFFRLKGFRTPIPEDGTERLSRNVGKKFATTRCVMTQKSAVFICFEAEA